MLLTNGQEDTCQSNEKPDAVDIVSWCESMLQLDDDDKGTHIYVQ